MTAPTTVTPTQTNRPSDAAIARAAQRAHDEGIIVVGRGYRKSDHAPVYAVTSASHPTTQWYLVAVEADRLVCNCKNGQHGGAFCKHRYVVRQTILSERAATQSRAARAAEFQRAWRVGAVADVADYDMDAADARRATAPLARDNAPFSIFKSGR